MTGEEGMETTPIYESFTTGMNGFVRSYPASSSVLSRDVHAAHFFEVLFVLI
jgi:hypothetical protein